MSVLVVERDPVVREGLCSLVRAGAAVAGAVPDVSAARRWVDGGVDVVVAGIAPDNCDALSLAAGRDGRCGAFGLLLVAARVSDALVRSAFQAGARGLLLRDSATKWLVEAVHVVGQGGTWVDSEVGDVLVALTSKGRPGGTDERGLTVQERRVLRLLPQQLTNREIAHELGVSPDTVKTHLRHAREKLGANDRVEAARIVQLEGIC